MFVRTLLLSVSVLGPSSWMPATRTTEDLPDRWGRDGHRIVCEIALGLLTEETDAWVDGLLGNESLGEVCSWADEMRSTRYPETAPFHYVNLPPGSTRIERDRVCADGCVVTAIERYGAALSDASLADSVRVEALKFLAHFVGDVHQPLHAGYASDRGGNDVSVVYDIEGVRRERNLHSFWDSGITDVFIPDPSAFVRTSVADLSPAQRALWSDADLERWALESFRLTERFVYSALTPPSSTISRADDDYLVWARELVELRLRQGGVRLAYLLNEIADGRTPF